MVVHRPALVANDLLSQYLTFHMVNWRYGSAFFAFTKDFYNDLCQQEDPKLSAVSDNAHSGVMRDLLLGCLMYNGLDHSGIAI
jgi:hypothetical protein